MTNLRFFRIACTVFSFSSDISNCFIVLRFTLQQQNKVFQSFDNQQKSLNMSLAYSILIHNY